jgi:hypothetical protein
MARRNRERPGGTVEDGTAEAKADEPTLGLPWECSTLLSSLGHLHPLVSAQFVVVLST